MLFDEPTDFEEALQSRAVKALLPTTLAHDVLSRIRPAILERAQFAAKASNAAFVEAMKSTIDEVLAPKIDERGVTVGLNLAQARVQLKEKLKEIGYEPERKGTIQDLSSNQRLNLIIETQTRMAAGYGNWAQAQDADVLDLWPAQELYRLGTRKEPRDWNARWKDAGGQFFEGFRKIALKNDPIWIKISAFGTPYPPFDFNSGMDIRDVSRKDAEKWGLIQPNEKVMPETRDFAKDVGAPASFSPEILDQILQDLGPGYAVKDGVLTHG